MSCCSTLHCFVYRITHWSVPKYVLSVCHGNFQTASRTKWIFIVICWGFDYGVYWYLLNTKHRFLSSMLEFFPLVYFSLSLFQIVQGLGVGVLTKKFSENDILKWSSFLLVWSYLALVRFYWYINKKECQVSITADNSPVNMMFSVGFGKILLASISTLR